jgi:hypothetical protein
LVFVVGNETMAAMHRNRCENRFVANKKLDVNSIASHDWLCVSTSQLHQELFIPEIGILKLKVWIIRLGILLLV